MRKIGELSNGATSLEGPLGASTQCRQVERMVWRGAADWPGKRQLLAPFSAQNGGSDYLQRLLGAR